MAAAAQAVLDSWEAAGPRRRRRASWRPRRRPVEARGRDVEPERDPEVVLRRLREAEKDLLVSDFWSSSLETVSRCLREQLGQLKAPVATLSEDLGSLHLDAGPGESEVVPVPSPREALITGAHRTAFVCYGLGNFASCVTARIQLAFLLLLLDKCETRRSHCWIYDPLFSQLEITVLKALGVRVLSENEEGKHRVCGAPTVFYMPHCGTALYNNLLWSNWSLGALSRMVIIGNSFRSLEERLPTRILQKNYTYIAEILGGLEELELPQTTEYMDTFNDTSVHWFPVQKLEQLPRNLWASQKEPEYQDCGDLEIIRKTAEEPPAADPHLPP
ncbi:SRR1-like protein [Ctenodactylus gundi]